MLGEDDQLQRFKMTPLYSTQCSRVYLWLHCGWLLERERAQANINFVKCSSSRKITWYCFGKRYWRKNFLGCVWWCALSKNQITHSGWWICSLHIPRYLSRPISQERNFNFLDLVGSNQNACKYAFSCYPGMWRVFVLSWNHKFFISHIKFVFQQRNWHFMVQNHDMNYDNMPLHQFRIPRKPNLKPNKHLV